MDLACLLLCLWTILWKSMEYKEDYLTGQVFAETLSVLGWTRIIGTRRKYLIRCSECAKDPELFQEGLFETSKESSLRGYKPCGCGKSYRFSEDQYKILIERKALKLGVQFLGFSEEFKDGRTRCRMSCEEGEWFPSIYSFIHKGQIKFNRGKACGDDSEIIEKFFSTGVFHKDTKFSRYRLYDKWYWKVDCPVCRESGVSQSQHLQRGSRPCACGNYKQRYSYIHGIYDNDVIIAIKFGVSRMRDMRIKYQARETAFRVESLGVWEYEQKHDCVSAERLCKSELVCGTLSKWEFGDGYTETTYPHNIGKVIEIYENHGGIKVE